MSAFSVFVVLLWLLYWVIVVGVVVGLVVHARVLCRRRLCCCGCRR